MNELIKQYFCKVKNKRIWIELFYFESEKNYCFRVSTKNYKGGRHILKTDTWYSVETFQLIRDLMQNFYDIQVDMVVGEGKIDADLNIFNKVIEHYNSLKSLV